MAPVIDEFWASLKAQRPMLVDHGVPLEDAIEAAESTGRHYRTRAGKTGERRYVVPGKTDDGWRLWVVFADEGGRRARIITAFEPTSAKDQARHRRMRGD